MLPRLVGIGHSLDIIFFGGRMRRHDTVVIVDFGAANGQAVAKAIRALNIYCEVVPYFATAERIAGLKPAALVLQRGTVCGATTMERVATADPYSFGVPVLDMACEAADAAALENFLVVRCGLKRDWTADSFIEVAVERIRAAADGGKMLLAMSGGVDSSVCAALAHRAVGSQLVSVYVDHGLMRKGETAEVCDVFGKQLGIELNHINAADRFLARLAGVVDPEQKRRIIGEEFIRVFEEAALGAGNPEYLVQGTIYPDIIESGAGGGKAVKAHHNVGGLPERIAFKGIIEPLKYLFKDEVRQVALALGIPASIAMRQPFPGPGLAVRCIGEITRERLDILREADAIFRAAVVEAGLERIAGQYFAVLTNNRSVGMDEGGRTYAYTVALRAVQTSDYMQARFVRIPMEVLAAVSGRITATIPQVNRVVYDITDKPPATIEWE